MKPFFPLIMLLLLGKGHISLAQQPVGIWFRYSLSIKHNSFCVTDVETQGRTIGSFGASNPFQIPALSSFRVWNHAQLKKGVKISLSPAALFNHYSTTTLNKSLEYRNSLAVEWKSAERFKTQLSWRNAMEGRFLIHDLAFFRARSKVEIQQKISPDWSVSAYYEILLQNKRGEKNVMKFQQDRFGLNFNCKCNSTLSLNVGYLHPRLYLATKTFKHSHVLQVNMKVNLPSKTMFASNRVK